MANPNAALNLDPEHQWKPGQSGNPKGRQPGIARQARELVGNDPAKLLNVLLDVANDENAKAPDRIAAAKEFLDRAWGKSVAYEPQKEDDPLGLGDARDKLLGKLAAVTPLDAGGGESPAANGSRDAGR